MGLFDGFVARNFPPEARAAARPIPLQGRKEQDTMKRTVL